MLKGVIRTCRHAMIDHFDTIVMLFSTVLELNIVIAKIYPNAVTSFMDDLFADIVNFVPGQRHYAHCPQHVLGQAESDERSSRTKRTPRPRNDVTHYLHLT